MPPSFKPARKPNRSRRTTPSHPAPASAFTVQAGNLHDHRQACDEDGERSRTWQERERDWMVSDCTRPAVRSNFGLARCPHCDRGTRASSGLAALLEERAACAAERAKCDGQRPVTSFSGSGLCSHRPRSSRTSLSTSAQSFARGPGRSRFVEFVNTMVGATARSASTLPGISSM